MVTKSTILGGVIGITTFLFFPGNPLGLIGAAGAGLTTAAITKLAAARLFHEGEAKAPEGVRERPLREEVKKKPSEDALEKSEADRKAAEYYEEINRLILPDAVASLLSKDMLNVMDATVKDITGDQVNLIRNALTRLESIKLEMEKDAVLMRDETLYNSMLKKVNENIYKCNNFVRMHSLSEARKLISSAVKNNEITPEKAEELLINLESNKISPESIKALFGRL